jgi:hypothetical protein
MVTTMPCLFAYGEYHVYVRDERTAKHKSKHCHVTKGRWSKRGRRAATVLELPSLRRIIGPKLPKIVMKVLENRLDKIVDGFDAQNPEE